eukprot:1139661-Pleurochrysis_carterae.AAC.2
MLQDHSRCRHVDRISFVLEKAERGHNSCAPSPAHLWKCLGPTLRPTVSHDSTCVYWQWGEILQVAESLPCKFLQTEPIPGYANNGEDAPDATKSQGDSAESAAAGARSLIADAQSLDKQVAQTAAAQPGGRLVGSTTGGSTTGGHIPVRCSFWGGRCAYSLAETPHSTNRRQRPSLERRQRPAFSVNVFFSSLLERAAGPLESICSSITCQMGASSNERVALLAVFVRTR